MSKFILPLFVGFLFISTLASAFDFDSDTTAGSQTFSESLTFNGYFGREDNLTKKELNNQRRGTWNLDYLYSRQQVPNSTGTNSYDNTTELDLAFGSKHKKVSEFAIGLTFTNTPDENLKEDGPNFYFGQTFALAQRSEEIFYPTLAYKFYLSDLAYVQTFSTSIISRTGKVKPATGTSGINQLYPALQLIWEVLDPLTLKSKYTHYFYNRNVNDFLATLDSPRVVGLNSAVSSFNTDMWELDVNWFPLDSWEFDEEVTAATSAIDGTTAWTIKEVALYDISKRWSLGLAYEYEDSDILTEHLYTLTVRYSGD